MQIMFINNGGGGFADYVEVEEGISITQFFSRKMPEDAEPGDYLIRVNRQPVPSDYIIKEGDRITCTPTKIEGAATSIA